MLPEVGARSPERTLTSVLLPAPFGPITACSSPTAKWSETLSTAVSPRKRLVSCTALSTSSGIDRCPRSLPQQTKAGQSAGHEKDDQNDENAHRKLPMLGKRAEETIVGEHLLQQNEGKGADDGSIQPAHPTEDEHHQNPRRVMPREDLRVDEPELASREIAGQTRQAAGEDEGSQLVPKRRKTERAHPLLIDAHRRQGMAKRRGEDGSKQEEDPEHQGEHQVVKMDRGFEVEQLGSGQLELRSCVQVQAVGAAAQLGVVKQVVEHLGEGQGDHDEVDACGSNDQQADQQRKRCCDCQGEREGQPEAGGLVLWGEKGDGISPHPEERSMPKADQATVPDEQVETHRENREHHDLAQKLHVKDRAGQR